MEGEKSCQRSENAEKLLYNTGLLEVAGKYFAGSGIAGKLIHRRKVQSQRAEF
jgi:hypothetical protein